MSMEIIDGICAILGSLALIILATPALLILSSMFPRTIEALDRRLLSLLVQSDRD